MARDSCNLDKDEAEILKRSSSPPPPTSSSSSSSSSSSPAPSSLFPKPPIPRPEAPATDGRDRPTYPSPRRVEEYQPSVRLGNRCSSCRKRVGLTGFRCRCGDLFCARHRYSDVHHCPYDYKAAAREEISKANPLIRAPKIIRI